jgi:hypothetical protein
VAVGCFAECGEVDRVARMGDEPDSLGKPSVENPSGRLVRHRRCEHTRARDPYHQHEPVHWL